MHESLVAFLNRRFVCTYFDAFPGPGHDEAGVAFAKEVERRAGKQLRYGALVTPDGELLASFGFDRDEMVAALRTALAEHSEWDEPRDDEAAILAAAADDVPAQLRAARLECDLLQHARARARLERLASTELARSERARVGCAHAHAGVIDLGARDLDALRAELQAIEDVPDDLRDDWLADLVSLDLELAPGAFYGGWRMRAGVDAAATATSIEAELARAPASDRAGELRFQLGLCRVAQGDLDAADRVFAAHVRELPDDRYALLSHIHHRSYAFHPTENPPIGGLVTDPKVAARLRDALRGATDIQITTPDGRVISADEAKKLLEKAMSGAIPGADAREAKPRAPEAREPR